MSSVGEARSKSRAPVISRDTPVVFVVDDDVSVRESLELLILSAGWQPETFESAEEFLERSRVDAPSCLVLDVTLPRLSGLDLQKRIIDRADMPVIFITGYGDVPTTVRAMKAGAAEFLTKPFGDDVLLNAISQAIERSRTALAHEAGVSAFAGPGISAAEGLRRGWFAQAAASALWDDDAWRAMLVRQVRLAHDAGALDQLPIMQGALGTAAVWSGDFAAS